MPAEPEDTEDRRLSPESEAGGLPALPGPRLSFPSRVARGALLLLALVVAGGFILILLPGSTVKTIVGALQATRAASLPPEKIALLYLGDEVRGKEFHIRGIVRNIAAQPLEKADATIRLYSTDNNLLETVVVRMDLEVIPPDGTAEFHLVYPNFAGQFGTYSVDFKARDGEWIPHRDRRGARHFK